MKLSRPIETVKRIHASDPSVSDGWWCHGEFDKQPSHYVIGHPVHCCRTCGDYLFIGYPEPKVKGINA